MLAISLTKANGSSKTSNNTSWSNHKPFHAIQLLK
jgi:hypothetical protein